MFDYIACTKKGRGRKHNEDRAMINDHVFSRGCIYGNNKISVVAVICDGVGENKGGSIAAKYVASSFIQTEAKDVSPLSTLNHLNRVNESIKRTKQFSDYPSMATTVAGMILFKKQFLLFNIGDTRIYEYNSKGLNLLSEDHVSNCNSDALTQCISTDAPYFFPMIKRGVIEETESWFLICSDGVYKSVTDQEIQTIIKSSNSIENKERAIMQKALQNGSMDDLSCIIIRADNNT